MFLELIGTVFAGIAMAGVVMLLNRMTGGRLPRWVGPVAAGLAMIGVTISMEYSWYDRTTASLPDGVVVAQSVEKTSFYQPWTKIAPYVHRFVAVDQLSIQRNPDLPDQRILDLYFFGRWAPMNRVPVLMDCATPRMATLADGVEFDDSGAVIDPRWIALESDDEVLRAVCEVA
ncbi:hypothetical protein [Sedimentitalea arenosa]|jgi:hypothetical protein|uniref:Uncharacterized protein n=1 Tax=Sedimentitalea arenosa TaxID=2798803 RepID=A0A8J7IJB9_9RHOB|nr:hypothetical protein [Arenibacterium arenosum]MBJ6370428.1 hypothetical protein [Arenibacterium arenosum]